MAAPKLWGYTREKPVPDELLVSWADGDLTADVAREMEERLLTLPDERRKLASFARAVEDSIEPLDATSRERFDVPRRPVFDMAIAVGTTPAGEFPDNVAPSRPLPPVRILGGMALLVVAAAVAAWLVMG